MQSFTCVINFKFLSFHAFLWQFWHLYWEKVILYGNCGLIIAIPFTKQDVEETAAAVMYDDLP